MNKLKILTTFIFLLIAIYLPKETNAATGAAPGIYGHVKYSGTSIGIPSVWVSWVDGGENNPEVGLSHKRYALTDSNGKFFFIGWRDLSESDRNTLYNTWIKPDRPDLGERSIYADGWVRKAETTSIENSFGCGENPHTISVIHPAVGLNGSFTSATGCPAGSSGIDCLSLSPNSIKTSLNNNSNDVDVGIFYFTGNTNNASCKSISVSTTTPKTGSTFTANIQFTNTGNTTWTNSNNYHLGDPNAYYPQDSLWGGFNRVNLSFDPIPPSQTGTFTFTATAPNTPGNYTFNWKMIQDGVEWFGNLCRLELPVTAPQEPTGPIIESLKINNSSSTQTNTSGPYKVSGNQSGQGGSNWLNPVTITLDARPGDAGIKDYYVAFYDKSKNLAVSFEDLKNKASDPRNGFMLRFTPSGTSGNWYVLNKGNWADITSPTSPNVFIRDSSGQLLLTIRVPRDAYNPQNNTVSWQVYFEDRLGSKSMFTGAWVEDSNKKFDLKADINPSP